MTYFYRAGGGGDMASSAPLDPLLITNTSCRGIALKPHPLICMRPLLKVMAASHQDEGSHYAKTIAYFIISCFSYVTSSQLSFPLIQPSFVKVVPLAQYDKTFDACECMELVII